MTQALLVIFGLASLWMAMSHNTTARRWAPVVGLVSQFFWLRFAWSLGNEAWGLLITSIAYTLVFAHGAWMQWNPRRSN
jgi:hypothetical protein